MSCPTKMIKLSEICPLSVRVNSSLMELYGTSDITFLLENEGCQILRPEQEYKPDYCLRDLVILSIGNNWSDHYRLVRRIKLKYDLERLHRVLQVGLDVVKCSKVIAEGLYWKRYAHHKWEGFLSPPRSWKRYFIERYLTEYIESLEPGYVDYDELRKLVKCLSPFIKSLSITRLRPPTYIEQSTGTNYFLEPPPDLSVVPDRFDVGFLLRNLHRLRCISLTYGYLNYGKLFRFTYAEISPGDVQKFVSGVFFCRTLTTVVIHRCDFHNGHVRTLTRGLRQCRHVFSLEISHGTMTSKGAYHIADLILQNKVLEILNLTDNKITEYGANEIAYALTRKQHAPIKSLNMSLNNIGNHGALAFASCLTLNRSLKLLDLSATGMGDSGGVMLGNALMLNKTIKSVDVSCNDLKLDSAVAILQGLEYNDTIEYFKAYECGFPKKTLNDIERIAWENREKKRAALFKVTPDHLTVQPIPIVIKYKMAPPRKARKGKVRNIFIPVEYRLYDDPKVRVRPSRAKRYKVYTKRSLAPSENDDFSSDESGIQPNHLPKNVPWWKKEKDIFLHSQHLEKWLAKFFVICKALDQGKDMVKVPQPTRKYPIRLFDRHRFHPVPMEKKRAGSSRRKKSKNRSKRKQKDLLSTYNENRHLKKRVPLKK